MATTVRPCEIDRMLAGAGNSEAGMLKAKSGTTGSSAARRNMRAASALLFLSRYDRYWARRSATDRKTRQVAESILQAPTLVIAQGKRAIRAKTAHLNSAN